MSEAQWPSAALPSVSLAIKDGSHGTHKRVANGVPLLSAKNISESGTLQWGESDDKISEEDYAAICSSFTPRENDLLLTIVGTLGRRALFDGSRVAFQRSVAFVRPNIQQILPRYFFHATGFHDYSRQLFRRSNATAQAGLYLGELAKTTIPKPPILDQLRIGAVLDTVDQAIAKTEAVIAKLKQVRAGLLHDLLTRGLDKSGQLRPPVTEASGLYQDSPFGHVPRDWDVRKLQECYEIPSRNGLYKKASYYGFGHRMIHMPQMFKGAFVDVQDAVRVDVDSQELQRYALEEGDILFARRSLNLDGAGLCSMIGSLGEPATFESSIVRVRVKRDMIAPRFAVEFLRSPTGYLLRRRFIRQVAVSGVSSSDIAQFLVLCPKLPEQECVLSLLDIEDRTIRLAEQEAGKLAQLKSGLMVDLLTGRVRVPALPTRTTV